MKKIMLCLSLLLGCRAANACDVGYHLSCRSGGGRGAHYVCNCVQNVVVPVTCRTPFGNTIPAGTTVLLYSGYLAYYPQTCADLATEATCDATGTLTPEGVSGYTACSQANDEQGGGD